MVRFFEWLMNSPWSHALASAEWVFPIVQSLHFIGFAALIGTVAIVDLRLLGFGLLRQQKPDELAADLDTWKWVGLSLILLTGLLMFSSSALPYSRNSSFRFKMVCLMVALLFHFTLHRRALRSDVSPNTAKLAGAISLLLWSAVVAGGRMIAFV
jgi:hypothetical protein